VLQFGNPEFLWGLLSVPALAAGFYALHRYRRALRGRFVSHDLFRFLSPDASGIKRVLKEVCILLAVALLVLTLANPQVGTRLEEVKREGIDLFVAIDVSLSMKAEDIRPNRLEKAKRDVSNLLQRLEGDRVGLIVFAGEAYVQFPLTIDYSAADLFISAVDVEAVPTPGTVIGQAIKLAMKSYRQEDPTQKAMIIVSDGENTEGDIAGPVEEASKAGIKIFTIGMGTPEGGPIPLYDARGNRTDFKRDRDSKVVLTKLDETTLQQIAAATGGAYLRATSGGNEIEDVFDELASIEKTEFESMRVAGFESQYQYTLALAIFFLLIEFLLSERRGRVIERLRKLLPVSGLTCIMVIFAGTSDLRGQTIRSLVEEGNQAYENSNYGDAEAQYKKALEEKPELKEATFNLGDAYYKQQRYDQALQSFQTFGASTEETRDQAASWHNVGNTLFKSGKLKESIEAYKQALRLNPGDDETRYNLEMAKRRLQEQQQQQQQQQNKQDQNQQQDQKNDQQQQDQQNQQNQQDQNRQQQPQPQNAQQNKLPKEQADRILEALRNDEKEIQKQIRKREAAKVRVLKDW